MIPYLIISLMGIIIGSFLNVCIYRIPKKESIVYPGSHCGSCNHDLKAIDLIPIFSYLFLKGRCRYCQSKVSIQYPLIELINGVLYAVVYHYFDISILTPVYCILFSILLVVAIIDYRTMLIPNIIVIFGAVVALVFRIADSIYTQSIDSLLQGMIGMIVGVAIIGGIMLFSLLIFKREGMGMGDLKLLAMIGLFVGARYTLFAIFTAVILGGLYAVVVLVKKKSDIFPFGPFISVGAMIALLWGDTLWNLYISYML